MLLVYGPEWSLAWHQQQDAKWLTFWLTFAPLTKSCEPGFGIEMFISDDLAVTISVEPIPLGNITWQPSVLSIETVGTLPSIYTKCQLKKVRFSNMKLQLVKGFLLTTVTCTSKINNFFSWHSFLYNYNSPTILIKIPSLPENVDKKYLSISTNTYILLTSSS